MNITKIKIIIIKAIFILRCEFSLILSWRYIYIKLCVGISNCSTLEFIATLCESWTFE